MIWSKRLYQAGLEGIGAVSEIELGFLMLFRRCE